MFGHHAEKQNYDFYDVDTAQRIARDGQSGVLELERAAQVLDGEVDRLGTELDAARARATALETVIREYVAQAESGERFNALVSSVPGLQSDDGVYPR